MRIDVLRGTLDMLILRALSGEAMHGYAIVRWLERTTGDVLKVEEGSLYPALHRMEKRGWLRSEWGVSENNRRARYYRLTARGRERLEMEANAWGHFADAVAKVLRSKPA